MSPSWRCKHALSKPPPRQRRHRQERLAATCNTTGGAGPATPCSPISYEGRCRFNPAVGNAAGAWAGDRRLRTFAASAGIGPRGDHVHCPNRFSRTNPAPARSIPALLHGRRRPRVARLDAPLSRRVLIARNFEPLHNSKCATLGLGLRPHLPRYQLAVSATGHRRADGHIS